MEKLLLWLQGKKATILAVISITCVWLVAKTVISPLDSTFIITVCGVLAYGASYQTGKIYSNLNNAVISATDSTKEL